MKKHHYFILLLAFANSVFGDKFDPTKANLNFKANETEVALPFWKQAIAMSNYGLPQAKPNNQELKTKAKEWTKKSSVKFLENKGQMVDMEGKPVPFVLFKAEAPGLDMFITEKGITYMTLAADVNEEKEREEKEHENILPTQHAEEKVNIKWERIEMELAGVCIKKENIIKEGGDATDFNFFYPHCPDGIYGIKEYEKITIRNVYPGIDWVLYNSTNNGFKYDFVVHPNADYKQIQLLYKSRKPVKINANGEIELSTVHGAITENAPVSFLNGQEIKTEFIQTNQKKTEINGDKGYLTSIAFNLNSQQTFFNSDLIIDPQLTWGTLYAGSSDEELNSVCNDASGNVFATGYSQSVNFPTFTSGNFFQGVLNGNVDLIILKFNNLGVRLWATYYGGSSFEIANSINSDPSGNIFVSGQVNSSDLPTQNSGTFFQGMYGGSVTDAFILKFNNLGMRLWATYYGGIGSDESYCISCDQSGNVFVTGQTSSNNFPTQSAGTFFQGVSGGANDGFILKFDNLGNRLWATYYGGTLAEYANSVAFDLLGNVFVCGTAQSTNFPLQNAGSFFQGVFGGGSFDAFVLKFDNLGNRLWATYYGGNNSDVATSIGVDPSGNIFINGYTGSSNFPTQNAATFFQGASGGSWDGFLVKFDNAGNRLWATYFGGSQVDNAYGYDNIAIDNCGNVYAAFATTSSNMPMNNPGCGSYFDGTFGGSPGARDCYISKFSNLGNLIWTSYFGGPGVDVSGGVSVDNNNNLFMGGEIYNFANPTLNPGGGAYYNNVPQGGEDAFILKFINPPPTYTQSQINPTGCFCNGTASVSVTCGQAPFTYSWSTGASVLNTTLTSSSIGSLCPGVYQVTVTSNCNFTYTTSYTITTTALSPTANIIVTNASCLSPTGSVAITSITNGVPNYTIAEATNTLATNVTTPYTLTGVSVGTHTYVVTGANGCVANFTAAVVANTVQPNISITPPATLSCINSSVVITGTSTTGGVTYSWQPQNVTINTAVTNTPGNYTLSITNPTNGCVSTSVVAVVQNTVLPNVNAGSNATLTCSNPMVNLNGSSSTAGVTFSWQPINSNAATVSVNNVGIYTLTVTNPVNGCLSTATVAVSSTQSFTTNISVLSQINCYGANNGALQINLVGGGTPPFSITNLNNNSSISNISSFPINFNNLSAGNYSFQITDASGCIKVVQSSITQPGQLSATLNGSTTICQGQTTNINANVSGGSPPYSFVWSPTGGNTSTLTENPNTNVNFTLTVTDNNGCQTSSQIQIAVNPKPNAQFSGNNLTGCKPVCASFSLTGLQGVGYNYNWAFINSQTTSTVISQLSNPELCFTIPGSYDAGLIITTPQGCTATVIFNALIKVYDRPIADFTFTPTNPNIIEPMVYFTNLSTGANSYSWYNNNLFSSQSNPSYLFTDAGSFLIALIATNGQCSDTALKTISVDDEFLFYVPNAFTPNDDNLNDAWFPIMRGYKEGSYRALVFDRWGGLIFKSNDPKSKGWDGYYKGELCKDDVYVWKINVSDKKGKTHEYTGTVTLYK